MSLADDPVQHQPRNRFAPEEARDLEDVADPHTTADDSQSTLRERVVDNKWYVAFLILVLPFGVAGVGLLVGYSWFLLPEFFGNRRVQLTLGALTIMALAFVGGDRRRRGLYERYDWLVLDTPTGNKRYLGRHIPADDDHAPLFVPVKGFSRFGGRGNAYTIEELSPHLAETYAKANRDPDDPAVIRLHPEFASASQTDTGTVVTQPTEELRVDTFARDSTLIATVPEFIRGEQAEALKDHLRQEREETDELRDKIDTLERMLEEAKEIGAMPPDEFLESHLEFYERAMWASRRRRPGTDGRQYDGTGPVDPGLNGDRELRQVEQELSPDD